MDWNANHKMNTVHHMDPRHLPALGVPQHLGMVRTPVGMMPPGLGRHQMVAHQGVLRMGHPGMPPGQGMMQGMQGGHQGHHGQQQGPFVEDQMEHLAGKLDMLENELRYAWRALDVLSQEYIKMWERLEKMEGLLTEQQTVITQLIDLYTADSSDNADEFDNNGGINRFQGQLAFSGPGKLGPNPDESFYKSLNAVHKDSYPNTQDNFNTANKVIEKSPKRSKNKKELGPNGLEYKADGAEMDMDNKSMSSSARSTHSGFSEVGEFPVPADNSPTYENLKSGATLMSPCPNTVQPKRKLPQLPPTPQSDNRRTRKDGYIGESGSTGGGSLPAELNFPVSGPITSGLEARREQSGSPVCRQPLNGKEPVRKANSLQPKLATNIFTAEPQSEVQYDTYPRRKGKKKEKKDKSAPPEEIPVIGSPLTVIDGNYSFSLTDNGGRQEDQLPGQPREQQKGDALEQNSRGQGREGRSEKKDQRIAEEQQARQRKPSVGEAGRNVTMGLPLPLVQEVTGEHEVGSPLESGQTRANSLFQQIQAHSDPSMVGKPRKISLKEKRKLRAEQREHVPELLPKTMEIEPQPSGPTPDKPHSSESDVSMRSDHSVSPKRETEEAANGQMMLDQQVAGRPRSNGINLLPVQQQLLATAKSSSREFAVSRALGKYRQKQREHGSSNSDSQDELELSFESRHDPAGIESTLKTLDAKLAEIEEITEPTRSTASDVVSVSRQVSEFEEAGVVPIEMARSPRQGMGSRKPSATESIDTEDEWYKHEMNRLQKLEHEEQMHKIQSSSLVGNKMTSVLGELHSKVVSVTQAQSKQGEDSKNHRNGEETKPPDKPPEKRDSRRMSRKMSKRQLLRSSASSVPTEDEDDYSSATGSADDDSETQSGADCISDEEDLPPADERGAQSRPGNLILIPQKQTLNISNQPTKPDLLQELTEAAAEAAYPDHLKNGAFGEDGIWYDDKGETGYYGEDGEWYDYMDEIGYYDDSGEWVDYDYTTGFWDDEGEWKEKTAEQIAAAKAAISQESEVDHFLWVSEEGINESNDQIPSSELPPVMVIGKLASSLQEDFQPVHPGKVLQPNGVKHIDPEVEEEKTSLIQMRKDSVGPVVNVNGVCRKISVDLCGEETLDAKDKESGGGGRWGALIKQRKADILDLVRT